MLLGSLFHSIIDFHRGNFTPTVIAWTVMGLVGTILTGFNLRDAIRDMDTLIEVPPGMSDERKQDLLIIAKAGIRQEILRISKMLTIVAIGVVVALSTPVISDQERALLHIPYWTPTGIALTLALLYIEGAIVVQAVLDRKLRRHFYDRQH